MVLSSSTILKTCVFKNKFERQGEVSSYKSFFNVSLLKILRWFMYVSTNTKAQCVCLSPENICFSQCDSIGRNITWRIRHFLLQDSYSESQGLSWIPNIEYLVTFCFFFFLLFCSVRSRYGLFLIAFTLLSTLFSGVI